MNLPKALPGDLKVRRFQLKYILKKAVERWLPREIVYRQKRGFSVPIASWMRNELRPLVDETLGEEKLRRQGMFNAAFVRRSAQRALVRPGRQPQDAVDALLLSTLV